MDLHGENVKIEFVWYLLSNTIGSGKVYMNQIIKSTYSTIIRPFPLEELCMNWNLLNTNIQFMVYQRQLSTWQTIDKALPLMIVKTLSSPHFQYQKQWSSPHTDYQLVTFEFSLHILN